MNHLLRVVFLFLAALVVLDSGVAKAADLEFKRQLFLRAEEALQKGDRQRYTDHLNNLQGYPLTPYLIRQDLEKRMSLAIAPEIRSFLGKYDGQPAAETLRRTWLQLLGRNNAWSLFLADYREQKDLNLRCLHGRALLATGRTSEALDLAEALWPTGSSLPDACDPLLAAWMGSGRLTVEKTWQRIGLAMGRGQTSLAKYLGRHLPAPDKRWLDLWLQVAATPATILSHDWRGTSRPDQARMAAILAHGMRAMTRSNATQAAARWDELCRRNGLNRFQFPDIENDIALYMSLRFEPGALDRVASIPAALREDRLREWAVRAALRGGDWAGAQVMVNGLSSSQQEERRWMYWRARVQEELGMAGQARQLLAELSEDQDYFGLLAAGRLGREVRLRHEPVEVSGASLERIALMPGFQRAGELFALQRFAPARREWQQAQAGLAADDLPAAAVWASRLGWHDRAIVATAAAKDLHDLGLRFPVPHQHLVLEHARTNNLDPALVFGLTRQESLFMSDIGSSAGALGLMQIMPQTGQRIAGWHGEKLPSPQLLLQPDRNIRYGTSYLRRQLNDLQNHPALALAAYNAGQGRVKGWLPARPMAADVWIETIPFNETRNYVEKVMTNTVVYEARLGRTPSNLAGRLPRINPPG